VHVARVNKFGQCTVIFGWCNVKDYSVGAKNDAASLSNDNGKRY